MKKLILIVSLLLCAASFESLAQNYKYMSTDFAYKVLKSNGYWSEWSDWEDSHCLININLDREEVNIYSDEPQEFTIYDSSNTKLDANGGKQLKLKCVDSDGLRCVVRLRVQSNGQMQLYVDYNDLMYVYCIEER